MKLLFSEYCDFEDMVLIESPFAQTTREGKGVRQVHLGLTPSKLVLATDVLPPVEKSCFGFLPGIDPDIETFELIAIYPIDCVNLSVFRRHKRQTIKAHFCNNRVYYFELGGFENRTMFWNLWCEKVKFLSPESGSSHSETSVATSSTNSTLYLIDSKQIVRPNGLTQVWCKFGNSKEQHQPQQQQPQDESSVTPKWTDRYLYLGKDFEEGGGALNYKPIMYSPKISQFLKGVNNRSSSPYSANINRRTSHQIPQIHIGDSYHVNRFGSGIREGCTSGLFLPAEDYIVPRRFSQTSGQSSITNDELLQSVDSADKMEAFAEDCVRQWERGGGRYASSRRKKIRHKRRYGIAPQPLFLYGLGPWNINPGGRYSIQVKRAVSLVTIRRQPHEPELRLPVTKRQLVATISCEMLNTKDNLKTNGQSSCGGPRRPVIFFWTPDYWYRPRSAKDAYQELHSHLTKIRECQQKPNKRKRRPLFRRRVPQKTAQSSESETESCTTATTRNGGGGGGVGFSNKYRKSKKRKSIMRFSVFGGRSQDVCDVEREKTSKETSIQYLKRLLKIDVVLTAWDFNSTTLAQQLTMIDRDLFLKISGGELSVLLSQQSSKNAPNVAAMVAFAHRISCLVASDILKNRCNRMRARLIARFITVAEKCHRISNFHSCRTVLFGLQSPSIYRLRTTWAYVRKKHATKYEIFESLCRLYKDPRLLDYQKTFFLSSQSTPYMPFIGDVIAKLLDRIPDYKMRQSKVGTVGVQNNHHRMEMNGSSNGGGLLMRLFSNMRRTSFHDRLLKDNHSKKMKANNKKGLCDYFGPLENLRNNRSKCLEETTEFLQQCQLSALHYSFMPNTLATDYLLKARYKEERENFYQSFKIESVEYEVEYKHLDT